MRITALLARALSARELSAKALSAAPGSIACATRRPATTRSSIELIDLFVADLPKRLGAIAHAVQRADAPALALQAHALRGGAANFGASRLDELCAKIEEAGVRGTFAETPAMLEEVTRESARVRRHAADV